MTPESIVLPCDVRAGLRALEAGSVQCCITSPPYFGLRSYQTEPQVWGGDAECTHIWGSERIAHGPSQAQGATSQHAGRANTEEQRTSRGVSQGTWCQSCQAWRGSLGLEPDPTMFIAHLVEVFRDVRRVLRDDGTLWIVIGDSYSSGGRTTQVAPTIRTQSHDAASGKQAYLNNFAVRPGRFAGIKEKDLLMIPAQLALALRQPYIVPTCVRAETDRAWLAAMFDGEGCIGIRRFDSYRKEKQQVYQDGFVIYTNVTNNDVELLDRCIALTSLGKVALKQAAESTDGRGIVSRRDSYVWRQEGNGAISVIRAVYPYLIAKRKQACLAFTLDQLNKTGHGSRAVPSDVQEKKRHLWELIKKCNQRESVDIPDWVVEPRQEIEPGWYLRSEIIWAKGYSFHPTTAGSCMPGSQRDRPTMSHEHVFMLTKAARYYFDQEAVKETSTPDMAQRAKRGHTRGAGGKLDASRCDHDTMRGEHAKEITASGRTLRSVWLINPQPSRLKHYAGYPEKLVEPMVKAGTSERGQCPVCGAPWERVVEKGGPRAAQRTACGADANGGYTGESQKDYTTAGAQDASATKARVLAGMVEHRTVGWRPICDCPPCLDPVPQTVLDPFAGSGTTGVVCKKLGRSFIGLELNEEYCRMAEQRITETEEPPSCA